MSIGRASASHFGVSVSVLAILVSLTTSCSWLSPSCETEGTGSVTLTSTAGRGPSSSVAVEIAITTDETLAKTLAGLTGLQWFQQRDQILRDNPETLSTARWEIVLGQTVSEAPVETPCAVEAIYAYASYSAPGAHRLKLADLESVTLDLDAKQMTQVQ